MPPSEDASKPQSILRPESYETSQQCASPSTILGLNHSLSPKATPKSVTIAPQTEVISPLELGKKKSVEDLNLDTGRKSTPFFRRTSSKRLSGRPPSTISPTLTGKSSGPTTDSDVADDQESSNIRSRNHHSGHHLEHLINQVSTWIKEERAKQVERVSKHILIKDDAEITADAGNDGEEPNPNEHRPSEASIDAFDLDKLEGIIKQNLSMERRPRHSRNRSPTSRRKSSAIKSLRKQSSAASSDTDYVDNDVFVPSCNVELDNSNTLSYTGGASGDSDSSDDELERTTTYRDQDAWPKFKSEIVRITHTLRLKGWRSVSMDMSGDITVERLSGALTNAVYVVSPPEDLPTAHDSKSNDQAQVSKRRPRKLLLRIYGPNVEHLIDREAELAILRRLARKQIGPRLLGTFANGRFEEYLHAKPLTPEDFRNPDTSRQIAKRMRELHEGIELLDKERQDGPFVLQNWDKWVQRVEKVVSWLDCEVAKVEPGVKPTGAEAWKRRGNICGVPWKQFRAMVEKYRQWLYQRYGGQQRVQDNLVFAHNDTQYGNILRFIPTGDSPLLLPANSHKQLIVIDFEYASANVPGLEFANHFTEWCYNYHDPRKPYAFHPNRYPTPEEQDRFIRAYVRHRPQFNVSTPKLAPTTPPVTASSAGDLPLRRPTSNYEEFTLDKRTPQTATAAQIAADEMARKAVEDQEVTRLIRETRLWRLANTAQWVAWGIVQAKVPGMPDFGSPMESEPGPANEEASREDLGERAEEYKELASQGEVNGSEKEEVEEEFDYLGYAQHRALFFWADALQLKLADAKDLPEDLLEKVKKVPY